MTTDQFVSIDKIHNFLNREAAIRGWVTLCRDLGSVIFWEVRDGSGFLQIVISKNQFEEDEFAQYKKITQESAVGIRGIVRNTANRIELAAKEIQVLSAAPSDGEQLSQRHLALRQKRLWSILRIREEIIYAVHDFFRQNEFQLLHPPVMIPKVSSKLTNFELKHFNEDALLSASASLYMGALSLSFGKVYSLHPVFRAEKSRTKRHLSEFWMLEAEAAHFRFEELLILIENLVKHVVQRVIERKQPELANLQRDLKPLESISAPFAVWEYDRVIQLSVDSGHQVESGKGLGAYEKIFSKLQNSPVFVVYYPAKISSWTAKPHVGGRTLSLNLVLPEGYGEAVEGCERLTDYRVYAKKFAAAGITLLDWFIDINKFGQVERSGFGMGIERLSMWLCGIEDIKDTIAFPRTKDIFYP